ncbi:MAG TPA: KamA family radical SAM protein [Deltaproteobacteria bacterium]|nr:KamA family radical SAM protein [Deltaproteobacteria bacterium]
MYHGPPGPPPHDSNEPVDDPRTEQRSRMVRRPEITRQRPDLAPSWDEVGASFPVRITRSFWRRLDPADPDDPLALQVMPDPRELETDPGDVPDPVGDAATSPLPWVVHKHPDRVLLLVTKRCHLYCRYCFRRNHAPSEAMDPTPGEWAAALRYAAASGASEIILSGGDPLILPDRALLATLDALEGVPVRRIHTRAPITFPERVTEALVSELAARRPVWVVVHCNHPRELSDEVDEALARLIDGGVPVLNQAVLLRGVNDDVEVLAALSEALVRRRVFPYYLHLTDRAEGNAHLRIGAERGLALYRALRGRVSGIALPRFVVDRPDGSGKVDVETLVGSSVGEPGIQADMGEV